MEHHIYAQDLTPGELRESNLPDEAAETYWIGFKLGRGKYQLILTPKITGREAVLRGNLCTSKFFQNIGGRVARAIGGDLGGVLEASTHISRRLTLSEDLTQETVAGYAEKLTETFGNVNIQMVGYSGVSREKAVDHGLPNKKTRVF